MNSPFGMLLFFCIFVIPGGSALGAALRGFRQHDFSNIFFLIWGGGFGGIPFLIGSSLFLSTHQNLYFYALVFFFLMPVITVAFLPQDFMSPGRTTGASEGAAIAGAVLLMMGGTVVLLNMHTGFSIPLLLGGVLALVGFYLMMRTALRIVRAV